MTTLDMAALTARQRDVLGQIATGLDQGHHPKVLEALAAKNLIEGHETTLPGRFPVRVVRWEVPLDVHMQWTAWCAAQDDDEHTT
jgi:hypothetical protein